MMMAHEESEQDAKTAVTDMTLSDYVERAAAADVTKESDGSTVVYLHLKRIERYSTLPKPKWQSWFSRTLGNKPTAPETNSLGDAANVRRVPRGSQK